MLVSVPKSWRVFFKFTHDKYVSQISHSRNSLLKKNLDVILERQAAIKNYIFMLQT